MAFFPKITSPFASHKQCNGLSTVKAKLKILFCKYGDMIASAGKYISVGDGT